MPSKTSSESNSISRWDGLLEKTIVGSFTSIGHKVRSRGWEPIDGSAVAGKTVVMTGATSGIGTEVARQLAGYGAGLRFVARNEGKAETLRHDLISSTGNADISYYLADLSLVREVRRVAAEIADTEPAIHRLINNAVVLPPERIVTDEGLELAHATNLVAPFVLTNHLVPRMLESQPARIINVISGGMYAEGLRLDDLNYEEGEYRGTIAYARAKRGLMILTKLWAEQLRSGNVTANATHPGWVNTPGVETSIPTFHKVMGPFLRDVSQGADTILWLATAATPATETGKLWHDRLPRPEHRFKRTVETASDRGLLWEQLESTVARI
ncbi:MAG: SDR family NAD(P)-dependent oxidoreductase [Acidimicrobiia bacterium]|nr:SDR family NAD(P)-dependent oxidoreductase [Acidimicrobiia bacterium]